jgi:hypothetical protein
MFKLGSPENKKIPWEIQKIPKALINTMLYCAEYFIAYLVVRNGRQKYGFYPNFQHSRKENPMAPAAA